MPPSSAVRNDEVVPYRPQSACLIRWFRQHSLQESVFMARFQHLHFVVELYNAMHGHYASTTTITTDTGFVLEFLDEELQRVLSVSYDQEQQSLLELNQDLPPELQSLMKVIQEKWSATLDSFVSVDDKIESPTFVEDQSSECSDGDHSTS